MQVINALTFDVEDYFHVHAFDGIFPRNTWDAMPSRVVKNTRRIMHLLATHRTRATFFMLGWVAKRYPQIVREIVDGGHELATHGYAHEAVDRLDEASFRKDVERSLNEIVSAEPNAVVTGYRAPSFSINEDTPWAHSVLKGIGLAYDSSISAASFHDRYGNPSSDRFIHVVEPGLLEIPVSTIRLLGSNWQVAGGGYFRLAPLAVTRWAIRRINDEGHPAVVYLHPWEFDPGQPKVSRASVGSKLRHYINLHRTEDRLCRLLHEFPFGPISEVFNTYLSPNLPGTRLLNN